MSQKVYRGIDTAHYQPNIDWETVGKEIDFCYVKATDGHGHDSLFHTNFLGAVSANKPVGAYHFLRPGDGIIQANIFCDTFSKILSLLTQSGATHQPLTFLTPEDARQGKSGLLRPQVDVEWAPPGDHWKQVSRVERMGTITNFLLRCEKRLSIKPGIYTATTWWNPMIGDSPGFNGVRFTDYHLWIADYKGEVELPGLWKNYTIRQTSGHGRISGIPEEVDLDILRPGLTLADLCQDVHTDVVTVPPTPPTSPLQFTRLLFLSSPYLRGPDVLKLQDALIKLNLLPANHADGVFGQEMDRVIRRLQEGSNGKLTVDGKVGRQTVSYIVSQLENRS